MSDDRFLIPPPPAPEETQPALHPRERRRTNVAIGVALFAALFTGEQAYEAHLARLDAKKGYESQKQDVERSRVAAERSQEAANRSADAAWASVSQLSALAESAKLQLRESQKSFEFEHQPHLSMADASFAWLVDDPPRMDSQKATNLKMHWGGDGFGSCTLRSGARFAKDKKDILNTDYVLFPAVLTLSGKAQITYAETAAFTSGLTSSDGTAKLYVFGKSDCTSSIGSAKPYHSEWCFYFPVAIDGKIVDFIRGCKEPMTK